MSTFDIGHYREALKPVITENLLPTTSFMNLAKNDTEYVNGTLVRTPQRGNLPLAEINREIVPAQGTKRKDGVYEYYLSEFTTNPTVVSVNEQLLVSYDKKMSVITDHLDRLQQLTAESTLDVWSPDGGGLVAGSRIFETTGGSRPAASIPSLDIDGTPIVLTGNRKRITKEDFVNMNNRFNRENISKQGRVCLITSDQMQDLMLIPEFVDANKMGSNQSKLVEGSVGRLLGFDIFERSSVLLYSADAVSKKNNVTREGIAETDCEAALFWQRDMVCVAKGEVKLFLEEEKPEYYGALMSAMCRFGGSTYYKSAKGVFVLKDGVA